MIGLLNSSDETIYMDAEIRQMKAELWSKLKKR